MAAMMMSMISLAKLRLQRVAAHLNVGDEQRAEKMVPMGWDEASSATGMPLKPMSSSVFDR